MKNKIFAVLAIIILIGIILVATLGFNVNIAYKGYNLVDINIGKDFNISDIKSITDEVFNKEYVEIQKTGAYSDGVAIKAYEINDEQVNLLNTKINEKFGIENTIDDIEVNYIPRNRLRDIIKPYAIPLATATILILIYMCIRFRKLGVSKIIYQLVSLVIMAELLYGSIIAITRYPINRLVMPAAVIIYISVITVLTRNFEKQISEEKE